jgi:hypothetical protein
MSYPISRTSYNNDVGCGGSGEKSGAAIYLISKKVEENRSLPCENLVAS